MADPRVAHLKAVPIFAHCSASQLAFIVTQVEDMDFKGRPRAAAGRLLRRDRSCLVLGPRQFQNVLHQDVDIANAVLKALGARVREAGGARAD